jgi:hypothetical protein
MKHGPSEYDSSGPFYDVKSPINGDFIRLFLCRLHNGLVIKVIADNREFSVFAPDRIIVPHIAETIGRRIFPNPGIQFAPIGSVALGIDLTVQAVQLRMILVNPVKDAAFVVSAEV